MAWSSDERQTENGKQVGGTMAEAGNSTNTNLAGINNAENDVAAARVFNNNNNMDGFAVDPMNEHHDLLATTASEQHEAHIVESVNNTDGSNCNSNTDEDVECSSAQSTLKKTRSTAPPPPPPPMPPVVMTSSHALSNALNASLGEYAASTDNSRSGSVLNAMPEATCDNGGQFKMQQRQSTSKFEFMSEQSNDMHNRTAAGLPGDDENVCAKMVLICEQDSHPFKERVISLTPNVECKVGRLIAKSRANECNAIFDCKVLSRNHAVLCYADDGKFWVRDTKSSNGTFLNDVKLNSEPAELHFGDIVKFGVNVLENSRKEVHGCIIARVELFLPNGQEAMHKKSMSLDEWNTDSQISFEEMHRLNAFLNEAAQREKVLKTKLCNLQNIINTTKKNSTLCWKSMISEDQLLQKIHLLEKKLQIMEKNMSDSTLKNEVIKMLNEKYEYQMTAKDALQKVYQEHCEALQKFSHAEQALKTSANECSILRDESSSLKKSLQDLSTRLQDTQVELNDLKESAVRRVEDTRAKYESEVRKLKIELIDRTVEVQTLTEKLANLTAKNNLDEELQAVAMIDAVIPDFDDVGDSGDEDDLDFQKIAGSALGQSAHCHKNEDMKEQSAESKQRIESISMWFNNSDLKGDNEVLNSILRRNSDDAPENRHTETEMDHENWECTPDNVEEPSNELSSALSVVRCNLSNLEREMESSATNIEVNSPYKRLEESLQTLQDALRKHHDPKADEANENASDSSSKPSAVNDDQHKTSQTDGSSLEEQHADIRHILEMLQVECEDWKGQVAKLTEEVQKLHEEKSALENELAQASQRDENELKEKPLPHLSDDSREEEPASYFDVEIMDNPLENAIDELVQLRERLEKSERCNLVLRDQIVELQCHSMKSCTAMSLKKTLVPLLVLAIAAFYFVFLDRF